MSKINQCPICGYPNRPETKLCDNCHWYIPVNSENWLNDPLKKFGVKLLQNIEKWARRVWKRIDRYKIEISELEEKLARSELTVNEKIPQLEERIEQLSSKMDEKINEKVNSSFQSNLPLIEQQIVDEIEIILQNKMLQIISLEQQQEQFLTRITEFEERLSEKDEKQPEKNYNHNLEQKSEVIRDNLNEVNVIETKEDSVKEFNDINEKENKLANQLNQEENWIVTNYDRETNELLNYADSVSVTEKTINEIWKSKANQIMFQLSYDENEYWLLSVQNSSNIYLVPSHNLRINTNFKVVKYIFKLNDFSIQDIQNKYKLIKPAKVITCDSDSWKLIEKGILQF